MATPEVGRELLPVSFSSWRPRLQVAKAASSALMPMIAITRFML